MGAEHGGVWGVGERCVGGFEGHKTLTPNP